MVSSPVLVQVRMNTGRGALLERALEIAVRFAKGQKTRKTSNTPDKKVLEAAEPRQERSARCCG